ncbi:hypothetical protein NXS08_01420 [Gleimia sp. 6138-11-ORH1]|uniref:ABC transporter permease n=1 Tax=Gleimia sp. 6138-11-ORH1 TaxID=2973937 RepID=UPI00216A1CA6|nr:FtsX-like permease family protein [Gleimia sp. 6138-11-ORH1]MCS4484152.1 hypothetical protein [Gleimia sp. 6138-11-ORH1]
MFLALREIRHSASRFILITTVIFLVSYLVYFLTGLAYGLASSYTEAIRNWQAHSLIVSKTSNYNLVGSRITNAQVEAVTNEVSDALPVLVTTVVVTLPNPSTDTTDSEATAEKKDTRKNAFVFGIDFDTKLAPPLVEGELPANKFEMVADIDFKKRGLKIGDVLELPNPQDNAEVAASWKITGFTKAKFTATPTFFIPATEFKEELLFIENPQTAQADLFAANALIVFAEPDAKLASVLTEAELERVTPDEFIDNLPGYRAQILTFGMMIGSLIGITALVLSIFIYVLTVQKRQIFGIMKAQGISTAYIIRGGAIQTFTLSVVGVSLGFGAVILTSLLIGNNIPFKIEPTLYAAVTAGFIFFTVLGGLIPTRMISRIDPIEAIN